VGEGAAIRVEGLVRTFGERRALDGLDLSVPEGAIYGLVGPNGAGKTTLHRILTGLLRPTSGTATVLGGAPGRPEARARLGYMTQAEALYGDLTVEENVRFFGRLQGLTGDALREAARHAIDLVALRDRARSRVDTLSGGMRRRAALASAVVHRPSLLLLDEPTAGVDPELRAAFWDAFETWAREGTTLVVTTHHLDEAIRCGRIGLLREGKVLAEGPPQELLRRTGADTLEGAFLRLARGQA
jgi:ABC-2 type transport system ATP-binding protein